jgi:hypothetical protein
MKQALSSGPPAPCHFACNASSRRVAYYSFFNPAGEMFKVMATAADMQPQ